MSGFFSVKNFEKFQHYKDRNPLWIKLYLGLLADYEFTLLPDASKWHLVGIYLLASRYQNRIPLNEKWVAQQLGATMVVDLTLLEKAGFIQSDQLRTEPLASCYQDAIPETENKKEIETETLSLRSSVPTPPKRKIKSSLPENFPDEVSQKWAETLWLQKGRSDLCEAMEDEAGKFRDHHTSNNKTSADWPGSWRYWARNAINFTKSHRNGNGKLTGHQAFAAAALSIVRETETGRRDFEDDGPT